MQPKTRRVKFIEQEKVVPCFNEEDYERIVNEYGEDHIKCDFEPETYEGVILVKGYRVVEDK